MELDHPPTSPQLRSQSSLSAQHRGVFNDPRNILSSHITPKMRSILMDWLLSVTMAIELKIESFLLASHLIDAVLGREIITKSELQILGVSCLFLAAKYKERFNNDEIYEFVKVTGGEVKQEQIKKMEGRIFELVGCNLDIPIELDYSPFTPRDFSRTSASLVVEKNLLVVITVGGSKFLPSAVASSIISLAPSSCLRDIVKICKRVRASTLKSYLLLPGEGWLTKLDELCRLEIPKSPATKVLLKKHHFVKDLEINLLENGGTPTSKLGEGSYGVVKQVKCRGKCYALKRCRDGVLESHYLREVSVLLSLQHDNIPRIEFLVSDFRSILFKVGSCNLDEWLGGGSELILAKQILSALRYLHSLGYIHRDVKPKNILVHQEPLKFTLIDFGSCKKDTSPPSGGDSGGGRGAMTQGETTLWYRAPEILLGSSSYSAKVDVWSLVCTLYEYATKYPLFPGDTEGDQMVKICRVTGLPGNSLRSLPNSWMIPRWAGKCDIRELSPCYNELMSRGLVLDSEERGSSSELLDIVEKRN